MQWKHGVFAVPGRVKTVYDERGPEHSACSQVDFTILFLVGIQSSGVVQSCISNASCELAK